MRQLSLAIVGADYPNKRGPARRFDLAICVPGEPLELRPEPNNPADEHAIAVFSARNVQLGYLPSERAVLIGKLMRDGHDVTAVFQAQAQFGGWARVAFDGEQPVLPPTGGVMRRPEPLAEGADEESGFYPDPEWPAE